MIGKVLEAMITYYDGDIHYINHALKMYGYARTIAIQEGLIKDELEILEISAILHDIGIPESIKKYNSSMGKYQEETGMVVGREILENLNYQVEKMERVLFMIGNHHSYHIDGGIILQIIFEADFLVNIEEGSKSLKGMNPATIMERNFKTETGKRLIKSVYQL